MPVAQALLAGVISGASVAVFGYLIFGPLLATVPMSNRIRRQFNDPSNWVMIGLAISFSGQIACVVAGLLLGVGLWAASDDLAAGLGSPSWVYTVVALALVAALAAAAALFVPNRARRIGLMALFSAGCLGWMLPHLATL